VRLRIADGVYMILYPGLVSPHDAVSLLVDGGGKLLLIDSGSGVPASVTTLFNGIIEVGMDPLKLEWLINTHSHIHNIGGNSFLREVLHVKIAAHSPDSRVIELGDPVKTGARDLGLIVKPVPVSMHVEGDMEIEVGGLSIMLIHTPGHTPGSMSISFEKGGVKVLAVGDALGSLSTAWGSSEEEWWRSIERIKEERPDVLCTSIKCYMGEAAREYIRAVEREGPLWVER